MITVDEIHKAQALFVPEDGRLLMKSKFSDTFAALHIADHSDRKLREINQYFKHVHWGLANAGTFIFRVEWTRGLALKDPSFQQAWWDFVALDIKHFHTEIRSTFDYIASILGLLSTAPNSAPDSYRKVYEGFKGDKQIRYRTIYGEAIEQLVLSTDWFMTFRNVRDSLIHEGSDTLVFAGPKEGTLFQIFSSPHKNKQIIEPEFSTKYENVADFELYSAFLLTKLLLFFEGLAEVLRHSLALQLRPGTSSFGIRGLTTINAWMDKLAARISSS